MKIQGVEIKNYRSIVECAFTFDKLMSLVGENNAGKSNIIYALRLFFNENKPDKESDFNNEARPIEITIKFSELTDYEQEVIGEEHRDGRDLVIRKRYPYDGNPETTSVVNEIETNASPRGAQNFLADTLPELYVLPAVKEIPNEIKVTSTTNFGKLLTDVIDKSNEGFDVLDRLINQMRDFFDSNDEQMPLNRLSLELTDILNHQFSASSIKIRPKTVTRKDILKSLDVLVNDGFDSSIYQKGHGLQRAVIFSILRVWANRLNANRPVEGKDRKGVIIAIEEPEIYLHPQQQKIVYEILKELALQNREQIQVIYATHSSSMLRIEDYRFIGLVNKTSVELGTKVSQCVEEIFEPASKDEFRLVTRFSPERNELFFAKKIVLVEGLTEKVSMPILCEKSGLNTTLSCISFVECDSKEGLLLFIDVLSRFNHQERVLDFYVMHDMDVPWREEDDPDKAVKESYHKQKNQEIADLCDQNNIETFIFSPDFERELGIGSTGRKPLNAKRAVSEEDFVVPERLRAFISDHLST